MSGPAAPLPDRKKTAGTSRALDAAAFESLLRLLDDDRDIAGQRYESLRRKLTLFFESRSHADSEHLVDVVMDRVACKLRDGLSIPPGDSVRFIYGVARMIALEEHRRQCKEGTTSLTWDVAERLQPCGRELECLDRCLNVLDPETRRTLLGYYLGQGGEKLNNRTSIAARLGITHAALANRTWRIRTRLAKCVRQCVEQSQ